MKFLPLMVLAVLMTGCLGLPAGLTVSISIDGCTPDRSYCANRPANYYYPPTRTIVLVPGQGSGQVFHEGCHAHQHQEVLEVTGEEPDMTLSQWYATPEGVTFVTATGWQADGGEGPYGPTFQPNVTPWGYLAFNPLEDAAWTCAHFLLDPDGLRAESPERYAWAEQWLK